MAGIETEARRRLLDARHVLLARRTIAPGRAEASELESELAGIEDALARLDAGVFGICERCGDPIGRQRLRAIPETRWCSACANAVGAISAR